MTLPVLNDISKGIFHKYHNFHIEVKNSKKLAESPVSGELKQLFKEDFGLSGDMVVKHIIEK